MILVPVSYEDWFSCWNCWFGIIDFAAEKLISLILNPKVDLLIRFYVFISLSLNNMFFAISRTTSIHINIKFFISWHLISSLFFSAVVFWGRIQKNLHMHENQYKMDEKFSIDFNNALTFFNLETRSSFLSLHCLLFKCWFILVHKDDIEIEKMYIQIKTKTLYYAIYSIMLERVFLTSSES